jgi:hypothetical protein
MRVLILSDTIWSRQRRAESHYQPPYDVELDVSDLNETDGFTFSVFDYDVSIVHILKPVYHTSGYYQNLPKLLQDSLIALEHGRSVICLPESSNFTSERSRESGMKAYEWLKHLGFELQDNIGVNIKPSGAGRALVIKEYLKFAPTYYQIVTKPKSTPASRLAVVNDTEIVVGLEHQVKNGILVILPPPNFDDDNYYLAMSRLLEVARRYHDRSQRHTPLGDIPEWLNDYLVPHVKALNDQIEKLLDEKEKYDRIAYVLYGTGEELETSVMLLLKEFGLEVELQPRGANIDLKARHPKLHTDFAVEVTGTKDTIHKDNNKITQAWQYLNDRAGTAEEKDRLVVIANTQYHLDPKERKRESYSPNTAKLLSKNGVLMITTLQLYELWKAIYEGRRSADDVIQELYNNFGLFGASHSL